MRSNPITGDGCAYIFQPLLPGSCVAPSRLGLRTTLTSKVNFCCKFPTNLHHIDTIVESPE
jgi:hypothetical protein